MSKRENEVTEKESEITRRADEISAMEIEVKGFAVQLDRAVHEAVEKNEEFLRKEFATEKRLMEQEWRAEKNTLDTKIAALQDISKSQVMEIKSLKDALTAANQQAQTLAATVIESVSGVKQRSSAELAKE